MTDDGEGHLTAVADAEENTVTFTNRVDDSYTSISVEKIWVDESGKVTTGEHANHTVTVQLYKSYGAPIQHADPEPNQDPVVPDPVVPVNPDPQPQTRNVPVTISWTSGTPSDDMTVTATATDGTTTQTATLTKNGDVWTGNLEGLTVGTTYNVNFTPVNVPSNTQVSVDAVNGFTVDESNGITSSGAVTTMPVTPETLKVNVLVDKWFYKDGTTEHTAPAPDGGHWIWAAVQTYPNGESAGNNTSGNLDSSTWKKSYTVNNPDPNQQYKLFITGYQEWDNASQRGVDIGSSVVTGGSNYALDSSGIAYFSGNAGEVTIKLEVVLDEEAPSNSSSGEGLWTESNSKDVTLNIEWNNLNYVQLQLCSYDTSKQYEYEREGEELGRFGHYNRYDKNSDTKTLNYTTTPRNVIIHSYSAAVEGYQVVIVADNVTYREPYILPASFSSLTIKGVPSGSALTDTTTQMASASSPFDFLFAPAYADDYRMARPSTAYLPADAEPVAWNARSTTMWWRRRPRPSRRSPTRPIPP